jgi:hypothetical protein
MLLLQAARRVVGLAALFLSLRSKLEALSRRLSLLPKS